MHELSLPLEVWRLAGEVLERESGVAAREVGILSLNDGAISYGQTAIVDLWGIKPPTRLDIVDQPVAAGDYILNHLGFPLPRIC
ncbi:MAG TPA: hypothetical protein VJK71_07630 [Gemmatimonadales bacterium]|nr:hypothetical protein [Gemmatimonadales bacterium]